MIPKEPFLLVGIIIFLHSLLYYILSNYAQLHFSNQYILLYPCGPCLTFFHLIVVHWEANFPGICYGVIIAVLLLMFSSLFLIWQYSYSRSQEILKKSTTCILVSPAEIVLMLLLEVRNFKEYWKLYFVKKYWSCSIQDLILYFLCFFSVKVSSFHFPVRYWFVVWGGLKAWNLHLFNGWLRFALR